MVRQHVQIPWFVRYNVQIQMVCRMQCSGAEDEGAQPLNVIADGASDGKPGTLRLLIEPNADGTPASRAILDGAWTASDAHFIKRFLRATITVRSASHVPARMPCMHEHTRLCPCVSCSSNVCVAIYL